LARAGLDYHVAGVAEPPRPPRLLQTALSVEGADGGEVQAGLLFSMGASRRQVSLRGPGLIIWAPSMLTAARPG